MDTYSAVRDDALGDLDATGVQEALRRGDISANEAAKAAVRRAEDSQPHLNAMVSWLTPPLIGAEGPLAGVPSVIKDTDHVAGLPTREGSRAVPDHPATTSSTFVDLYSRLGLTLIGKSTMPEFGLTATTEPLLTGPTRNPWGLGHSTGGSSGGSAALVAAGVVPIAHANDGGGSIRIPAACCGLVGLKPSAGRLPAEENSEKLPVQIVSQGVLTRTVRDTAAFYAAAERIFAPPATLPTIGDVTGPGRRRLRIGIISDSISGPVDPDVRAALDDVGVMCESLGHTCEPAPFPADEEFARDFLRYWATLAFALKLGGPRLYGPEFDADALEPLTQGLVEFFGTVALNVPAAIVRLRRFHARFGQVFDRFDVLMSPTVTTPPPPIGYLSPALDFDTVMPRVLRFAGFTALQNVTGTPAISLPLARTADGLPIGLQFSAAMGDDRTLLELAYELEATIGWPQTPGTA